MKNSFQCYSLTFLVRRRKHSEVTVDFKVTPERMMQLKMKAWISLPSWTVSQYLKQERPSLKCSGRNDDPPTWCSGFLRCSFPKSLSRIGKLLSCSPLLWSSVCIAARQAMKNTPKRLPSVTVRSPLGASPPALDSQTESSVSTPPMETGAGASEDTTTTLSVVRILFCYIYTYLTDKIEEQFSFLSHYKVE